MSTKPATTAAQRTSQLLIAAGLVSISATAGCAGNDRDSSAPKALPLSTVVATLERHGERVGVNDVLRHSSSGSGRTRTILNPRKAPLPRYFVMPRGASALEYTVSTYATPLAALQAADKTPARGVLFGTQRILRVQNVLVLYRVGTPKLPLLRKVVAELRSTAR